MIIDVPVLRVVRLGHGSIIARGLGAKREHPIAPGATPTRRSEAVPFYDLHLGQTTLTISTASPAALG